MGAAQAVAFEVRGRVSRKGSIEVGKLADFVVLAAEPTKVKPETIKDIAIEKTFIGGKAVCARE